MTKTTPKVGMRVRTRHRLDFFPDFIVPAGFEGTVNHLEVQQGQLQRINVQFDKDIEGCVTIGVNADGSPIDEKNAVYWTWDHLNARSEDEFVAEWLKEVEVFSGTVNFG